MAKKSDRYKLHKIMEAIADRIDNYPSPDTTPKQYRRMVRLMEMYKDTYSE